MGIRDFSTLEISNLQMGRVGSTLINDTTLHEGEYCAILIIANTVFTTLTDATRDGAALTGITFTANTVIYGNITGIQLASGTVLAYKS